MINLLDFSSKTILLSGCGGIGSATAKLLSQLGAKIVLMDVSEGSLHSTLESLEGSGHAAYKFDLSDVSSLEVLIDKIILENGSMDGFVFCSGVPGTRPFKMAKYDFMEKVMDINYFSFIEITRCISQKKHFNEGMSIVGVSSVSALLGSPGQTAYCASKAAMNGAIRAMAKELSSKGIRINTVAPGSTDTAMFREATAQAGEAAYFKNRLERQYLGVCEPSDIADGIVFLLSNMSKKITGNCLCIDGGKLSS